MKRLKSIPSTHGVSLDKKLIALFLCFCMAFSQTTFAEVSSQLPVTSGQKESNSGNWEKGTGFIQSISIPQELGTLEETYSAPSSNPQSPSPKIIYIQDAHDSLEAQENIAKIIHHLVENHGVKTVFEEGYEGKVPTDEFFSIFEDLQAKEKVSYFLMDKLRMGGAEYAHVNRTKDFELIGVDNLKLHKENIEWYKKSAETRELIEKDLEAIHKEIEILASQRFPKELKSWMKLKDRLDRGQIDLLDYLKRITSHVIARSETTKQSLGREIATLLTEARNDGEGTYPNIELLLHAESSKDEKIIEQAQNIKAKTLFKEIDQFENDYAAQYLTNERDKKIYQVHKALTLLKRLNRIEVTPEEYDLAIRAFKELSTKKIAKFLFEVTGKPVILSNLWESHIQNAIQFYKVAEARDKIFRHNLINYKLKMKDQAVNSKFKIKNSKFQNGPTQAPSILVFGGFHKNKIKTILKENNFSYVIVTPRITEISSKHQDHYKHLMAGGHHTFETPFFVAGAAPAERALAMMKSSQFMSYLSKSKIARTPSVAHVFASETRINLEEFVKIKDKEDILAAAEELSLDLRTSQYGLLHPIYVGHLTEIRNIVSQRAPKNKGPRIVISGAGGVDMSTLLLSLDDGALSAEQEDQPVMEIYVVDFRWPLSTRRVVEKFWDSLENGGSDMTGPWTAEYVEAKFWQGYGASWPRGALNKEFKLVAELKALGVAREDIRVEEKVVRYEEWARPDMSPNSVRTFTKSLEFDWSRSGESRDKKKYRVHYIEGDLTKPETYLPQLEHLRGRVDYYSQKAAYSAAKGYDQYVGVMWNLLKPGGIFLTEDSYLELEEDKLKEESIDLSSVLAKRSIVFQSIELNVRGHEFRDAIKVLHATRPGKKAIQNKISYGWDLKIRQKPMTNTNALKNSPEEEQGDRSETRSINEEAKSLFESLKQSAEDLAQKTGEDSNWRELAVSFTEWLRDTEGPPDFEKKDERSRNLWQKYFLEFLAWSDYWKHIFYEEIRVEEIVDKAMGLFESERKEDYELLKRFQKTFLDYQNLFDEHYKAYIHSIETDRVANVLQLRGYLAFFSQYLFERYKATMPRIEPFVDKNWFSSGSKEFHQQHWAARLGQNYSWRIIFESGDPTPKGSLHEYLESLPPDYPVKAFRIYIKEQSISITFEKPFNLDGVSQSETRMVDPREGKNFLELTREIKELIALDLIRYEDEEGKVSLEKVEEQLRRYYETFVRVVSEVGSSTPSKFSGSFSFAVPASWKSILESLVFRLSSVQSIQDHKAIQSGSYQEIFRLTKANGVGQLDQEYYIKQLMSATHEAVNQGRKAFALYLKELIQLERQELQAEEPSFFEQWSTDEGRKQLAKEFDYGTSSETRQAGEELSSPKSETRAIRMGEELTAEDSFLTEKQKQIFVGTFEFIRNASKWISEQSGEENPFDLLESSETEIVLNVLPHDKFMQKVRGASTLVVPNVIDSFVEVDSSDLDNPRLLLQFNQNILDLKFYPTLITTLSNLLIGDAVDHAETIKDTVVGDYIPAPEAEQQVEIYQRNIEFLKGIANYLEERAEEGYTSEMNRSLAKAIREDSIPEEEKALRVYLQQLLKQDPTQFSEQAIPFILKDSRKDTVSWVTAYPDFPKTAARQLLKRLPLASNDRVHKIQTGEINEMTMGLATPQGFRELDLNKTREFAIKHKLRLRMDNWDYQIQEGGVLVTHAVDGRTYTSEDSDFQNWLEITLQIAIFAVMSGLSLFPVQRYHEFDEKEVRSFIEDTLEAVLKRSNREIFAPKVPAPLNQLEVIKKQKLLLAKVAFKIAEHHFLKKDEPILELPTDEDFFARRPSEPTSSETRSASSGQARSTWPSALLGAGPKELAGEELSPPKSELRSALRSSGRQESQERSRAETRSYDAEEFMLMEERAEPFSLDPDKTALVIVDVQKDFFEAQPGFALYDRQIKNNRDDVGPMQEMVDKYLLPLIDFSRKNNLYIIFIQSNYPENTFGYRGFRFLATKGTSGHDFYRVQPDDTRSNREVVIEKSTPESFEKPDLKRYLLEKGIEDLIITGYSTGKCVKCLVTHSDASDFNRYVVRQAVTTTGYRLNTDDHLKNLYDFGKIDGVEVVEYNDILNATIRSKTRMMFDEGKQLVKETVLPEGQEAGVFKDFYQEFERRLQSIEQKIREGTIQPNIEIRTMKEAVDSIQSPRTELDRRARVGSFGVTANPFQWGHLLAALTAIDELNLDTLVFLVQGEISHKLVSEGANIPKEFRHLSAIQSVQPFFPLLRYSDIMSESSKIGEESIQDLRQWNLDREIDFFFLGGSENEERLKGVLRNLKKFVEQSNLKNQPQHSLSWGVLTRGEGGYGSSITEDLLNSLKLQAKFPIQSFVVPISEALAPFSSSAYRKTKDSRFVAPAFHQTAQEQGFYGFSREESKLSRSEVRDRELYYLKLSELNEVIRRELVGRDVDLEQITVTFEAKNKQDSWKLKSEEGEVDAEEFFRQVVQKIKSDNAAADQVVYEIKRPWILSSKATLQIKETERKLSLQESFLNLGVTFDEVGALNFENVPEESLGVVDDFGDALTGNVISDLDSQPEAELVFPVDALPRLPKIGQQGSHYFNLGIIRVNGKLQLAAIRNYEDYEIEIDLNRFIDELKWAQSYGLMGGAQYRGVIKNEEGKISGYVTDLILGRGVKIYLDYTPAGNERAQIGNIENRFERIGLRIAPDLMLTRFGGIVPIDPGDARIANEALFNAFLKNAHQEKGNPLFDDEVYNELQSRSETRSTSSGLARSASSRQKAGGQAGQARLTWPSALLGAGPKELAGEELSPPKSETRTKEQIEFIVDALQKGQEVRKIVTGAQNTESPEILFFLKPRNDFNAEFLEVLYSRLESYGYEVSEISVVPGSERNLSKVRTHYATIFDFAFSEELSPEDDAVMKKIYDKPEFQEVFGVPFDQVPIISVKALREEFLLTSAEIAAIFDELLDQNRLFTGEVADYNRLTSSSGVNPVKSHPKVFEGKRPFFIPNAFASIFEEEFTNPKKKLVLFVLKPKNSEAKPLSVLRKEFLGQSAIQKAMPGSLRHDVLSGELVLAGRTDAVRNVAHMSDGYLSALGELLRWKGVSLEKTYLGKRLLQEGYHEEELLWMLENPSVVFKGKRIKLFKLLQAMPFEEMVATIQSLIPPLSEEEYYKNRKIAPPSISYRSYLRLVRGHVASGGVMDQNLFRSNELSIPFKAPQSRSALNNKDSDMGIQAIRDGKVERWILAGGTGGRAFGYEMPEEYRVRGLNLMVANISSAERSAIEIGVAHARWAGRTYGGDASKVPVRILTSELSDSVIRNTIAKNGNFGHPDISYFVAGSIPRLKPTRADLESGVMSSDEIDRALLNNGGEGGILRLEDGTVSRKPMGHLSVFDAAFLDGTLLDAYERGSEYILMSNDTELGFAIDPVLLSEFIESEKDILSVLVHKNILYRVTFGNEEGSVVLREGKVVESTLPEGIQVSVQNSELVFTREGIAVSPNSIDKKVEKGGLRLLLNGRETIVEGIGIPPDFPVDEVKSFSSGQLFLKVSSLFKAYQTDPAEYQSLTLAEKEAKVEALHSKIRLHWEIKKVSDPNSNKSPKIALQAVRLYGYLTQVLETLYVTVDREAIQTPTGYGTIKELPDPQRYANLFVRTLNGKLDLRQADGSIVEDVQFSNENVLAESEVVASIERIVQDLITTNKSETRQAGEESNSPKSETRIANNLEGDEAEREVELLIERLKNPPSEADQIFYQTRSPIENLRIRRKLPVYHFWHHALERDNDLEYIERTEYEIWVEPVMSDEKDRITISIARRKAKADAESWGALKFVGSIVLNHSEKSFQTILKLLQEKPIQNPTSETRSTSSGQARSASSRQKAGGQAEQARSTRRSALLRAGSKELAGEGLSVPKSETRNDYLNAEEAYELLKQNLPPVVFSSLEKAFNSAKEMVERMEPFNIERVVVVGLGSILLPLYYLLIGKEVVFVDKDPHLVFVMRRQVEIFEKLLREDGRAIQLKSKLIGSEIGRLNLEAEGLEANSFDLVTMIDLVGGEPQGSPKKWLETASRLIKKEGGFLLMDESDFPSLRKKMMRALQLGFSHYELLFDGEYFNGTYNTNPTNRFYRVRSEARQADEGLSLSKSETRVEVPVLIHDFYKVAEKIQSSSVLELANYALVAYRGVMDGLDRYAELLRQFDQETGSRFAEKLTTSIQSLKVQLTENAPRPEGFTGYFSVGDEEAAKQAIHNFTKGINNYQKLFSEISIFQQTLNYIQYRSDFLLSESVQSTLLEISIIRRQVWRLLEHFDLIANAEGSHPYGIVDPKLNVNDLLKQVMAIEENRDGVRDALFHTKVSFDLAERSQVYGDQVRLHNAFAELIRNAIFATTRRVPFERNLYNYSPYREGSEVKIKTTYDQESDSIQIVISDNGVGMNEKQLSAVQFFAYSESNAEENVAFGGMGIGIPTAIQTIEEHGGTIDFESAVGQGTTITIQIPKNQATPLYSQIRQARGSSMSLKSETRSLEIIDQLGGAPITITYTHDTSEGYRGLEYVGDQDLIKDSRNILIIGATVDEIRKLVEIAPSAEIDAVDIDRDQLLELKDAFENDSSIGAKLKLYLADATSLHFLQDETYDFIFGGSLDESAFLQVEDEKRILSQIAAEERRLLKPGGYIYHIMENAETYHKDAFATGELRWIEDYRGVRIPGLFWKVPHSRSETRVSKGFRNSAGELLRDVAQRHRNLLQMPLKYWDYKENQIRQKSAAQILESFVDRDQWQFLSADEKNESQRLQALENDAFENDPTVARVLKQRPELVHNSSVKYLLDVITEEASFHHIFFGFYATEAVLMETLEGLLSSKKNTDEIKAVIKEEQLKRIVYREIFYRWNLPSRFEARSNSDDNVQKINEVEARFVEATKILDDIDSQFRDRLRQTLTGSLGVVVNRDHLDISKLEFEVVVNSQLTQKLRNYMSNRNWGIILDNLFINAFHAMMDRKEQKLTIHIEEDESDLYVMISDTGHGIPKDKHEKVFEYDVSQSWKPKANIDRSGIGLFQSRNIVESHDGELYLGSSTVDEGSMFVIVFSTEARSETRQLELVTGIGSVVDRASVQNLQGKYVVPLDLDVFEKLGAEQQEEFYKAVEMYSENEAVKFVFIADVRGDRQMTPVWSTVNEMSKKYKNVAVKNLTSTNGNRSLLEGSEIQGRKILGILNESNEQTYAERLKEEVTDSEDLFWLKYLSDSKEAGLLMSAIKLLDSGQDDLVRLKGFFTTQDIPGAIRSEMRSILMTYEAVVSSA